MFPTHVGIARLLSIRVRTRRDVPYACGDCAALPRSAALHSLCSLRMWGLRIPGLGGQVMDRMFPTHVGIARPCVLTLTGNANVPYACGDCAAGMQYGWQMEECSLRMWGLRGCTCTQQPANAMFPTHVGIARLFQWL